MRSIPTFLRDAFERPPEREGREVWFTKTGESSHEPDRPSEPADNGDDATKPQRDVVHNTLDAVINSATERQEEPEKPVEGDDKGGQEPPTEILQTGEAPQEPEEQKMRITAEILVEKAKSTLATLAEIRSILTNREFMEKIRAVAKKDRKVQDLLTSFEEDIKVCDAGEKIIQDLKSEAEQFVLWQDPERKLSPNTFAGANVRARCIVLKPGSPEEEEMERQLAQGVHDYLSDPTVRDHDARWNALSLEEKEPTIERLEELAHIDETLEEMDKELTGYDTGLKVYLQRIKQLKDDREQGREISPPQQEWGGGSFNLKLIHFVYLAKAIQKIYDTWKKQWEYDFERAVGDCAAAISPWIAPNAVTQRLHQEQDANMRQVKESLKKVYDQFDFAELHGALLAPHPDPAVKQAQIEVAAEHGWLYDITPNTLPELTLFFGTEVRTLLPTNWSKGRREGYIQGIIITNNNGGNKREQAGYSFADQYEKAWKMVPFIRKALKENDYHYARGIVKRAIEKGDLGHTPTWATMMVINALRDPTVSPYFKTQLIKEFGDMVVKPDCAAPQSYLLLTTKFLAGEYAKLAGKGAKPGEIFLTGTPGEQIAAAIVKAEELIHTHGGPSLDTREQGFVGSTPAEKTEYAVGKLLAGTVVSMTDGTAMSLYDNVPEFKEYLRIVKESWKEFPAKISVDRIDRDYTITTSEILLMPPAVINPFFQPNTNGVLQASDKATGLLQTAAREASTVRQHTPGAYPTFINAMKERFHTPIINFLTHRQSHIEVESLKEGLLGILAHNIITIEEIRSLRASDEMRKALERMGIR